MLVLSRQRFEKVIIRVHGENIEVSVQSIRGDKVRLGIVAAPHVTIHRAEVQRRVDREAHAQTQPQTEPQEGAKPNAIRAAIENRKRK